jgi:hypothetical protein
MPSILDDMLRDNDKMYVGFPLISVQCPHRVVLHILPGFIVVFSGKISPDASYSFMVGIFPP